MNIILKNLRLSNKIIQKHKTNFININSQAISISNFIGSKKKGSSKENLSKNEKKSKKHSLEEIIDLEAAELQEVVSLPSKTKKPKAKQIKAKNVEHEKKNIPEKKVKKKEELPEDIRQINK